MHKRERRRGAGRLARMTQRAPLDKLRGPCVLALAVKSSRTAPRIAWLSPSVPPLVNTTSPGLQPSVAATRSRASSKALRASRAKRCDPDGLAYMPSRYGVIASIASTRIGVLAAWSRYVPIPSDYVITFETELQAKVRREIDSVNTEARSEERAPNPSGEAEGWVEQRLSTRCSPVPHHFEHC